MDALRRDPAAAIALPAAQFGSEVGSDEVWTPTGPSAAFYGHIAGTGRSSEEVRAYFHGELVALGWQVDQPPLLSTREREGWGWCKPGLRFRLTIMDRRRLEGSTMFGTGLPATIYDATLVATSRPCPAIVYTWPPSPSR